MLKKPIRRILSHAGIVQAAKLRKQADIQEVGEGFVMSTQEYIRKVVENDGGSGMLDEEEIMKMLEEEEMAKLELQVHGNITDQREHQHKFEQEALILALEEEVTKARDGQEWREI
uniref:Uncharacterized protein n=1 Tax=Tanacetum cinerariifolium TaxID=118510 RepID=A0A699KQG7_TANCI|nr:hypothetical protein [Tanacetum cinerariifolium]